MTADTPTAHTGELAQYHPRPTGHFVFSEAVWTRTKATLETATDDTLIAGQIGRLTGTPVYIDRCPWRCDEPGLSDSSGASDA